MKYQVYKVRLGDTVSNAYTDSGIVYVITHDKHNPPNIKGGWKMDVSPLDAVTQSHIESGYLGDLNVTSEFMGLSQDRQYTLQLRRFQPRTSEKNAPNEWIQESYTNYLDHVISHYLRILQESRWIQNAPQILSCS